MLSHRSGVEAFPFSCSEAKQSVRALLIFVNADWRSSKPIQNGIAFQEMHDWHRNAMALRTFYNV